MNREDRIFYSMWAIAVGAILMMLVFLEPPEEKPYPPQQNSTENAEDTYMLNAVKIPGYQPYGTNQYK